MDEDEAGYVWTFLRDVRDPSLLEAGAMLDKKRLREVLKSAGWTAAAITAVIKAIDSEQRLNAEPAA